MTLPAFGLPRIRICDGCKRYVRCRDWHDRCPKCDAFVIHRQWVEIIEAGVHTKVVNGEPMIVVGPDTEDPSPIR